MSRQPPQSARASTASSVALLLKTLFRVSTDKKAKASELDDTVMPWSCICNRVKGEYSGAGETQSPMRLPHLPLTAVVIYNEEAVANNIMEGIATARWNGIDG